MSKPVSNDPDRAIAEFWVWWQRARGAVGAALAAGAVRELPREVGPRVAAIHKDLQWEFAPGTHSRHALVVTPCGKAELRALAARWRAAAPPEDETWEYQAARQAAPGHFASVLELDGQRLELSDVRFAFTVDEERGLVDAVCCHPALPSLPEGARAQVAFLALDWLLGEEAVELWVGEVDFAGTHPDARPREELAEVVQVIADKHRDPIWQILQGELPDGRIVMALVQQPLASARWPRFDTHAPVVLPFSNTSEAGMPLDPSLFALRDLEDRLTEAVGTDGELVAHETCAGVRTLHYYVDSTSAAVDALGRIVPAWAEGRARFKPAYDPALAGVRHLRG